MAASSASVSRRVPAYPVAVQRSLWMRVLQMILLAIAFQIAITVLGAVALLQLAFAVFGGGSNARLRSFGRSLGRYLVSPAKFQPQPTNLISKVIMS